MRGTPRESRPGKLKNERKWRPKRPKWKEMKAYKSSCVGRISGASPKSLGSGDFALVTHLCICSFSRLKRLRFEDFKNLSLGFRIREKFARVPHASWVFEKGVVLSDNFIQMSWFHGGSCHEVVLQMFLFHDVSDECIADDGAWRTCYMKAQSWP